MRRLGKAAALCALILAAQSTGGCAILDGTYYVERGTFAGVDLAAENGITFEDASYTVTDISTEPEKAAVPNFTEGDNGSFRMRVYQQMNVYDTINSTIPSTILTNDTIVILTDFGDEVWMQAHSTDGEFLGFVKDGFLRAIPESCEVYAELPIEYGKAKDYSETYWDCYSHLVDVRKYFRCYVSTLDDNEDVDWENYDLKISMKLSTDDTTIGEPFYRRNLCMLQYDLLPKLKRAMDIFAEDGYKIIIYDAYRPTSVQQRWFDVVKVHAWVANPQIGLGGVHDRGTAIDMSLIDKDGKELEFATPMHTFTVESSRHSKTMSEEARKNMDYMTEVMTSCGFTYIDSEWWHFQDVNTKDYLPTDHPIDSIPLVPSDD